MKYRLPMRVAMSWPLRPLTYSDQDGGWAVFDFDSREDAIHAMKVYPNARMPCWRRIERGEVWR